MRIIIFSTLFLGVLFAEHGFSQNNLNKSVDSIINITTPRFFNVVILISQNGSTIYEKSHGHTALTRNDVLQIDDQFLIGSISKQFTATLVLKEIQLQHLKADHTIRYYLPDFKNNWADSVTVKQLLNHTSGISDWNKSLSSAPGSKFLYSNINYVILGKIVEKTTGKSYEKLTADLFEICRMKSSTVPPASGRKNIIKKLVTGHSEGLNNKYHKQNILELLDSPMMGVPASGMISTAPDLAQWLYRLHTGKILADSTYQMMITNGVKRPHRWGDLKYGAGIQVDKVDGITEYSMSGYVPGFISTIIYYPKTYISVVVLENISPLPADLSRVFFFHDQIRKFVRTSFH
jgi:D-alanyl-D-alanine carboxypeptidase